MRIVLARHGRPAWDFRTPIPGHAFCAWRRGEDEAPLDPASVPGAELERLSRTAACLVASPLRRSQESARRLAPGTDALVDARFREAELPCAFRSGLRLPPEAWGGLARAAWFCGWSAGAESFRAARARAAEAARTLAGYAESRGPVVLVGHGMINILIGVALRRMRWRGPRWPSRRHWAFGLFELR
jgi:broad specificity phosphatase PhoE